MAVSLNIAHKRPSREHLMFSDHMTAAEFDHPIRETYIGQAHIAGTGPAGSTCRECDHWHKWKYVSAKDDYAPVAPGYFSKKHGATPNEPRKAYCNRPMLNKPKRLIPHTAKACRLFQPAESPMPAMRPEE